MGQSLVKNYLHVVFSTKHRQPIITEGITSTITQHARLRDDFQQGSDQTLQPFKIILLNYIEKHHKRKKQET
jgi:hypothetical protein